MSSKSPAAQPDSGQMAEWPENPAHTAIVQEGDRRRRRPRSRKARPRTHQRKGAMVIASLPGKLAGVRARPA